MPEPEAEVQASEAEAVPRDYSEEQSEVSPYFYDFQP
jgi:hypothetical protein